MKKVVSPLFGLILMLVFSSQAYAGWFDGICHHTYKVKGQIKIFDDLTQREGSYKGLPGIKVWIHDGFTHVKTFTDAGGHFQKTFKSCLKKIKLSLSIVPTTPEVNVSQWMIPNYYRFKPAKKIKGAKPGTHNFGTIYYGKNDSDTSRILKVFYSMKKVLAWLRDQHGIDLINEPGVGTGHVEVAYPGVIQKYIDQSSFYNPLTKQISIKEEHFPPLSYDMSVIPHEFGHLFQYAYGRQVYGLEDLNDYGYDGDPNWSYASEEYPEIADLEGFATAIEYLFMADQDLGTGYQIYAETNMLNPDLGEYGAINHAGFYYDLIDKEEDQDEACHVDRCSLPLKTVMNVFAKHKKLGLKRFSIGDDNVSDFIDRYYEIYGEPPAGCDFDSLLYLNHLAQDPDGDQCDEASVPTARKKLFFDLKNRFLR